MTDPQAAPPAGRAREAFERALEVLARKERTAAELARWLAERGFCAVDAGEAIERLAATGGLDDERFARRFAADKRELRGWGPERIRAALAERGLDAELIETALGDEGRAAQLERATALLARRGHRPADEASRARALAFLARRGYERELAYDAVRAAERRAAAALDRRTGAPLRSALRPRPPEDAFCRLKPENLPDTGPRQERRRTTRRR